MELNKRLNSPILFVGGPKDGERLRINEYYLKKGYVQFPVMEPQLPLFIQAWWDARPPTFEYATYRLELFGKEDLYHIWCYSLLSIDKILELLIDGYENREVQKDG